LKQKLGEKLEHVRTDKKDFVGSKVKEDEKALRGLLTERNTHTVGCGGENMIFPMSTQSTDARDMVKDFSSTF